MLCVYGPSDAELADKVQACSHIPWKGKPKFGSQEVKKSVSRSKIS